MKLINEFRKFAIKGNMIEVAIGIVIGIAFNKVIDVLVKRIISPPLNYLISDIHFERRKIMLRAASEGVEEISIGYGAFLEAGVHFIIIASVLFGFVKIYNKIKDRAEDVNDDSVETPKDIELLSKIHALMVEQNERNREN